MSRDWQKDWELCQCATPGKWEVVAANSEGPYLIRMPYPQGGTWYGVRMVAWKEDAEFIAAAREGWPAALEERARLEKRVKELETALKITEKQLEIATREITHINSEFDTCPSEYDGELTCTCNGTIADVYQCWRERWKQKALKSER